MRILVVDSSQAEFYKEQLGKAFPAAQILAAPSSDDALPLAEGSGTEVLIGLAPYLKPPLLAALPDLKWIQALTTGVDNLMALRGIAITNCHGIHGPQMAELAVLLMMTCARRFDHIVDNQRKSVWDRKQQPLLTGKIACLLGVGAIAEHTAQVLTAFGMTVTGVTSRDTAPGFERLYPRAQLHAALEEADFVIMLTPYNEANHHIVDAEALAAMRPSACLINLSRGGCLDEDALLQALNNGAIAAAASDVFQTAPLPPENPLWRHPNMIVTPHIGGFSDIYQEQALPIVIRNLRDFQEGGVEALKGRLDT